MASNFSASLIFVFLVAPIAVYGATYNVDWTLGTDYSTYGGTHSVDVVSKDAYASCDASSATSTDNSGKTSHKLTKEGAMYFICGTVSHCPPMKLQLNVKAASSSTTPATSTAPTSSTTPSTSTPSTTNTTTSTTKNGAPAHGLSWLAFGVSLVFGLAFMG